MTRGEQRMRGLLGAVTILSTLLVAPLIVSPGAAFAQTAAEDQYTSAASDQYQDGASGQMPAGVTGPADPVIPDPQSSQTDPPKIPASSDGPADSGPASGSPGTAFDQAPKDASSNHDTTGQSLTAPDPSSASTAGTTVPPPSAAPSSGDAQALGAAIGLLSALLDAATPSTTTIGNPLAAPPAVADQCVPGPGVFCVGGADPVPPPMVVDQCTPGPGVACIGGGAQPQSYSSFTGGVGSPAVTLPTLIGSLVPQTSGSLATTWLLDDPGDSDGDRAVSTDLNPGSYDADPTDHDGDNQVFSDPDESDPDE